MNTGTFDLYNVNLETTDYGQVFQRIIKKDGFSSNIIENYDNEILNKIKEIVENESFEIKGGTISFEDVSFEKPRHDESDRYDSELYPRKSREKTIPYFANLRMKMVFRPRPTFVLSGVPQYPPGVKEESEYISQKAIPVMLGSKLCHLYNKSDQEKMEMGECFNDQLGYFIIKSERTIINQENLRISVFLIYKSPKDYIEGRITCQTLKGTMVTAISIDKDTTELSVILQHMRKNSGKDVKNKPNIPLFQIFKLFGMNLKDAVELILSFFPKKIDRQRAYNALQPTIIEYNNLIVSGNDTIDVMIDNLLERRKRDKNVTRESVISDIERDMLSHIKGKENKLLHLAMYASRMIEVMINIRNLDDRDSWANKRIATPGRNIYNLFKATWTLVIQKLVNKTRDSNNLRDVLSKSNFGEIYDNFVSSFGSASWGVKSVGASKKENIVDSLKRETPLSVYSQIGRIKPPSSTMSKKVEPRMPHGTQLGYICLYETPEGEGCGIVKNLASSCYISLERDPEPIINLIKNDKEIGKHCFQERLNYDLYPVVINGVIEGWCEPNETEKILRKYKSEGKLYKDVCILRNMRDRTLEIFCDGGRPTRPLFVVDKDTRQLIIDQKNLWKADVDTLIRENCIEYIDAREQEWIMLAESPDIIRSYSKKLAQAERGELTQDLEAYLSEYLPYSHCEIDPVAIFGIAGNLVPQANRLDGPRTGFQINMSRQALTQYHSNEYLRFDSSFKMIHYPTRPLFQCDLQNTAGLNLMPNGQVINVAYMAHPDNAEDGVIMKEEIIKYNNKFDCCKKFIVSAILENAGSNSIYVERFERPPIKPNEPLGKYAAINEKGIPRLDAYIRPGDCIISKVREYKVSQGTREAGTIEAVPICAGIGEEGYIDRVLITKDVDTTKTLVRVKIRQNRKYIPGDKLACLSPDHAVLTANRGWVYVHQINLDDKIATLNSKNELEYQEPTAVHHYSYEGPMYSIKSQQIDQFVTPEHRMYIKKRDSNKFELCKVSEVFGKRVNYKKNAINILPDIDYFELPETTYSFNSSNITEPARKISMDAWLTYFGIWIGDGWANERAAVIAANKPRVKEALDKIENLLGVEFTRCKDDKWNINKSQFSIYFMKLSNGAYNKHLPNWCFNLSERQSRVLIEGLMLSDGCKQNSGSYHYYTSSPQLVIDIQRLSLHAGWSANVSKRYDAGHESVMKDGRIIKSNYDSYLVKINRNKNEPQMNHGHTKTQNGQNEEIINYSGSVHCITVPNGIFYIQRNGIPSWTGNSRYAQKGTITKIIPARDLPRVSSGPLKGMTPDIIINPHNISRMTITKIIEILVNKSAIIEGRYLNSTTFRDFNNEIDRCQRVLRDYGLDENGKEEMELPNGTKLKNKIYFGPCFYQILKHHVVDKIQMRAKGGIRPTNHQPLQGRANEGGLRFGEMERDSLISHGASALLRERLCDVSDAYNLPICGTCGTIAITNHTTGENKCNLCGPKSNIGVIRIPYVIKLLLFYLNAAGIMFTFKVSEITKPDGRFEEKFLV